MNHWNRRLTLAAALASLATPVLAADPAPDCTVCKDPTWPTLANPMPPIALHADEGAPRSAGSPGGVAPWLAVNYRSPGVGVSAAGDAAGTVYADPTWPQMKAPAVGMAAATPAAAPARAAYRANPPA